MFAFALSFLTCAHAQAAPGASGTAVASGTAETASGSATSEDASKPALDAALPEAAGEASDATSPAPSNPQVESVRERLAQNAKERAQAPRLLPWLAVGVGAGIAVVAGSVGVIHTLSCDDCHTLPWVSVAVVAGATILAGGAILTLHAERNIRSIESQRYQLEQELERMTAEKRQREHTPDSAPALLALHFSM